MCKLLFPAAVLGLTAVLAWPERAGGTQLPQIPSLQGTPGNIGSSSNQPPVCCIGPNCVHLGLALLKKCEGATTSFLLDASGSYDPEGQPLSFTWTACAGAVISNPSDPITLVTLDTSLDCAQSCAVRLKVSDGEKNGFCRVYIESIGNEAICPAKPSTLAYTYVGTDCSASNYVQDPANVTCSGDPMYADPVQIVVTKSNKPNEVYFSGIVPLGGTFVEDGAGFPSGKVAPNTRIQIYDMLGTLLQDTSFHTSCSQPLEVGDQFGASIITGFTQ